MKIARPMTWKIVPKNPTKLKKKRRAKCYGDIKMGTKIYATEFYFTLNIKIYMELL
jgi:hypothetical protein